MVRQLGVTPIGRRVQDIAADSAQGNADRVQECIASLHGRMGRPVGTAGARGGNAGEQIASACLPFRDVLLAVNRVGWALLSIVIRDRYRE